jgi:unsaturated chondroitin disaccharide hydrolase
MEARQARMDALVRWVPPGNDVAVPGIGDADDPRFWRERAEHYSKQLEPRKEDRDVHDLGFIFYHGTYKRWFEATVRDKRPQKELNDVVIRAGQVLAMRFNEKGKYLRSFHGADSIFIDIMMNVGVIFYAARLTGDVNLMRVAREHCATTIRTICRADGSTAHEGIFDLGTGEFLRQTTQQGYRGDSCWSRGLAWSLYGFGTCYELTGDRTYLNMAESHADYYLWHTQQVITPWDYDAPADASAGKLSRSQPDSSAAAIAAVALFNLGRFTPDRVRAAAYASAAMNTVRLLSAPPFLASDDPNWEGILKRGVYHIHKDLGVDESVMWGEFFFVEALTRALAVLTTHRL